jgi:hypothetical protein
MEHDRRRAGFQTVSKSPNPAGQLAAKPDSSVWRFLRYAVQGVRRSAPVRALLQRTRETWTGADDEYLRWLGYANAGLQHPGNLHAMEHVVRNLPGEEPVVEIGTFCGLSANALTYLLGKHHRPNLLFTCDCWDYEAETGPRIGKSELTHAEYRAYVKESYLRNIRTFSGKRPPHTMEARSQEFFDAWRRREKVTDVFGRSVQLGGPVGFCLIDGAHTYPFVRRDFEDCDEFLVSGGFLLFDDSGEGTAYPDVPRVVGEALATGRYELAMRNPHDLLRKK